ncbi:hypothetical protein Daudx_1104 [Candidatus Desulforudis audaxviator]|nr:hypothetical protein Daudx_1104 [Candidatus Desulforudis audaxviator]
MRTRFRRGGIAPKTVYSARQTCYTSKQRAAEAVQGCIRYQI